MAKIKRVLFFDDDSSITKILAQNLELDGWKVTLVTEINDLFMYLKNHKFDIIILDIMAPIPETESEYVKFTKEEIAEMDDAMNTGVVAAKKIWRMDNQKYKDIPILFLSAKKDPRFENPELQNDKCDYFRQPELVDTIKNKLNELLNK
jgi:CheY-like chemotaxis protein